MEPRVKENSEELLSPVTIIIFYQTILQKYPFLLANCTRYASCLPKVSSWVWAKKRWGKAAINAEFSGVGEYTIQKMGTFLVGKQ